MYLHGTMKSGHNVTICYGFKSTLCNTIFVGRIEVFEKLQLICIPQARKGSLLTRTQVRHGQLEVVCRGDPVEATRVPK